MEIRNFSAKERAKRYEQLTSERHDVLVVGGGITGAGIALDASSRGMKTAVLEMQDFAAGTSSRSTKLVHGGLRYLKQFEVALVAEVGKERAIVYENGPHVTTPEQMLLPMHKGGTFGPFSTSIGLMVYDFLAGVKRAERRMMLKPDEVIKKAPLVKKDDLVGGGYYVEYRTDDARLTIEVAKEAANHGALLMNYAKVTGLIYENGKVAGVHVEDQIDGSTYDVYAKKIINATGPWVDELREEDNSKKGKQLRLTKGIHLVIDQSKFPLKQAIYFDTPDGRMVFAIPRGNKAYVGTTDTFFDKNKAHPRMTTEDRDYILEAIHYMFPDVHVTADDVESSWAGIRPLIYEEGKDPSEISRKDEIWQSDSGLITIAGGKLTGYRKMSETVVDLVAKLLKEEEGVVYLASRTKHMPMSGGHVGGSKGFKDFLEKKTKELQNHGLDANHAEELIRLYGSNIDRVIERMDANAYDLPEIVYAQLVYGIEEESVVRAIDFLIRRTGAMFFDIDFVRQYKDGVLRCMADVFKWSDERLKDEREEIEKEIEIAVVPVTVES